MRKIISSLLLILFVTVVVAQNEQDSAWIKDNYSKLEQYIPMRDGIKLFTTTYIPNDKSEKHPVLMVRTPYSCAPYGKNFLPGSGAAIGNIMREKIISLLCRM